MMEKPQGETPCCPCTLFLCSFFYVLILRADRKRISRGPRCVGRPVAPLAVSVSMYRPRWRCPHPPSSLTLGVLPRTPLARELLGLAP